MPTLLTLLPLLRGVYRGVPTLLTLLPLLRDAYRGGLLILLTLLPLLRGVYRGGGSRVCQHFSLLI